MLRYTEEVLSARFSVPAPGPLGRTVVCCRFRGQVARVDGETGPNAVVPFLVCADQGVEVETS